LDDLVTTRRKVKRGSTLFSNGEKFTSLYAIRTGFFKTCLASEDGRDQVTGFQMAGEIIGLDGIVNDQHSCDAVALEDAEVCVMPFDRIEEISREVTALQHHVTKSCPAKLCASMASCCCWAACALKSAWQPSY